MCLIRTVESKELLSCLIPHAVGSDGKEEEGKKFPTQQFGVLFYRSTTAVQSYETPLKML